jgi:hypothetical protein
MHFADASSRERTAFWSTSVQFLFDVLFGILAPLLCLYFDPIVFRGDATTGAGFLSTLRPFGYVEIFLCTTALAYYLATRRASALLSGILLGGFGFAFILGLVMLPFTLMGLFVGIGVFGFAPFFTSFVFLRNACRCWRSSQAQKSRSRGLLVAALGIVLIFGAPVGLQWSVFSLAKHAIGLIASGSEQDYARAVKTLRLTRFMVDPDEIVSAYRASGDERARARLGRAYNSVTGKDIERRLRELSD